MVPVSILLGMFLWECVSRYYLNRIKKAQQIIEEAKTVKGVEVSIRGKREWDSIFFNVWVLERKFLAYKDGNEWKGLVGYEEYKELKDKFDLLTEYLKLEYVDKTTTEEPPKFIKKK